LLPVFVFLRSKKGRKRRKKDKESVVVSTIYLIKFIYGERAAFP
jgi:hypothetical protein